MRHLSTLKSSFRPRLCAALLLGALGVASPGAAIQYHWVGNGGIAPCTHATLQDAIVTAQTNFDDDVIFVVGNVTLPGALVVLPGGGYDLQITGGVSACGATDLTSVPTVAAPAGKRAITIAAGPGETITMWNLVLTNENGTYNGDGGAIYFTGGSAQLLLVHTLVRDSNCLGDGGGLYVNSGTAEFQGSTSFQGNSAAHGGAIATSAGGAFLNLEGVVVDHNTAFFDGGGLYVPAGLVSFDGATAAYPVALINNVAGGKGGGAYLGTNSEASFDFGSAPNPIEIALNQAGQGGGLYVESLDLVGVGNAVVELNEATDGGGIYVGPNGHVYPVLALGATGDLPLLRDNSANDGKAVFVDQGTLFLNGTITGHRPGAADSALITVGNGNAVLLGATIHHNTNARLVDLYGEPLLFSMVHSTVADNGFEALFLDQHAFSTPAVQVYNSVFAETEPFFAAPLPAVRPVLGCIVSRYGSMLQNLPSGTDTSTVLYADPLFLAAASGNYHLGVASPAVDRCSAVEASYLDSDGESRGFDAPNTPNPAGRTYDAGADEVVYIFVDGFESGNTSRWSATVP